MSRIIKSTIFKRWIMRTVAVPKAALPAHAQQSTVPVIVTLHTGERESWESTLSPHDAAHWALVIPNALLKARGLEVDDEVMIALEYDGERKPPELPEDIEAALQARPGALKNFRAMPVNWQRQMIRYIDKGKAPDTREKYIEITIERVNEHAAKRKPKAASTKTVVTKKRVSKSSAKNVEAVRKKLKLDD